MLKNYRLTSLKTLISCAAPLSAGVQQMLHKKYNTDDRTVYFTQGTTYAISNTTPVSDANGSDRYNRIRHD